MTRASEAPAPGSTPAGDTRFVGSAGSLWTYPPVLLAGALVLLLRLPFLTWPPAPDEAGYLLVGRSWPLLDQLEGSRSALYGPFWVDRPPLLLLLFKLVDLLPGAPMPALRLLGALACLVGVAAAAVIGDRLDGRRAAGLCALAAAALTSSSALGALEIDGELLAVPLAMASMALLLVALDRGRSRRLLLGMAAGATGTAALTVKQNVADAWVFAGVLVLAALVWRRLDRAGARVAGGFAAGAAAVLVVVGAWAVRGPGPGRLLEATYGFRVAAARTISQQDHSRPEQRLWVLLLMLVLSGLAALLAGGGVAAMQRIRRREAVGLAAPAVVAVELAGVVGGGSYWLHYLLLLVPGAVLLTALLAEYRRTAGVLVALVVASALVFGAINGARHLGRRPPDTAEQAIGEWIGSAASPGDSVVVSYGAANIVLASGLPDPYPLLWSLPVRVRDPQLEQLAALVRSERRPTWWVVWENLDTWGLDANGKMQAALTKRYRRVAEVCGHEVLLARDAGPRQLPPRPSC
ncbi:hypothetical protein [Nocardioides mesophilus]|uniref:Uncharacterized protein n=1 Tax=Nocardioides mesophilus TaxID=433659 RepID=A0A7G9REV0_9ACTN|nr:hypothetical protein [Nocardioides mesophilus]QNN54125.1 hypothetical protein H9L09_07065 [Nocardioides mesophilus]